MFGANVFFLKAKIILFFSLFSEEYQFAMMPISRLPPISSAFCSFSEDNIVFSAGLVFPIRCMSILFGG
jgi:hypothetical protein